MIKLGPPGKAVAFDLRGPDVPESSRGLAGERKGQHRIVADLVTDVDVD